MDFFNIKFLFCLAIFVQVTLQNPSDENVKSRHDHIIKSPNDNREYRGLVLKNEMKILLISDPETNKSAASLDVNVGSMSNPPELPGLAHLCEHMLFLGTKKYPIENDFDMFFSQHGGSTNAFTSGRDTNYQFEINSENLESALDRFAQFFLEPLFTVSSIDAEINAVNSEFVMNLKDDAVRFVEFDKLTADQKHGYYGFSIGNIKSLVTIPKEKKINIQEELLKFYRKWYSANIITLSVIGKENLDDLEEMTVKLFAKVENKNVEAPKWMEHPFNEEHFQNKWYIVPVNDIRSLIIIFPLPDLEEHFRSAPANYLSYLLNHQGEGSLQSVLKKKNWITLLSGFKNSVASGVNFFKIQLDLTNKGLNHIDDIITLIFQYINMIKAQGPMEWIFKEQQSIKNITFSFEEKSSPIDHVISTALNLQKYPITEILSGPSLLSEWKPDLINMVISYLIPEKIRVQVVAQVFENITTEVEPWYKIKFTKERIPASTIKKWNNSGINSDLKFPARNEFIPTNFHIKLNDSKIEKFPVIIKETPLMKVWFKKDDEFLLPKAYLYFRFVSPLAYNNPENVNNLPIFLELLKDSLTESLSSISGTGLDWELSGTTSGIELKIRGYDNKQLTLLKKIIGKMKNLKIDEQKFEIIKENYIRILRYMQTTSPIALGAYYTQALLMDKFWLIDDLLRVINKLTAKSVRDFIPQFFKRIHVECLIYGNVRVDEVIKTATFDQSQLPRKNKYGKKGITVSLSSKELSLNHAVNLKPGYHYLYEIDYTLQNTSATVVYYQIGLESTKSNMLLELYEQITSQPCYSVLRTKEQLGYFVGTAIKKLNGAQGFVIGVQGEKDPQFVEERIDAFMKSMENYIRNMSDVDFNKHKESVAEKISEKPNTMEKMANSFWNEISYQAYKFNKSEIEVGYLRQITKDQILQFYEDYVKSGSSSLKKLSIHVIPTVFRGMEMKKKSNNTEMLPILIEDINKFKADQDLYPLLWQQVSEKIQGMSNY